MIIVDGLKFKLGKNGLVQIDIADLPSGTKINLPVHIFRSKKNGPTLLLTAGLHGDEINGVEIVRQCLVKGFFDNLKCGSVIVIPIINIYGFINFNRAVPDGKDVNRSFPGSEKGSLASQVANELSTKIIPTIDFGIDFHTAGATRYNYPQIRYTKNHKASEILAKAFNAPVTIANKVIHKSFREEIIKQGKANIVFEGGESLRYDEFSIIEALQGVKRVLYHLGMINDFEDKNGERKTVLLKNNFWQRAEVPGLYVWEKCSGIFVREGERLGSIHDPHNKFETIVKAAKTGFIYGHNNATVINQGDALFNIGW